MQQFPSTPPISIGLSIVGLLAIGLLLLAFVAVVTVVFAARRQIIPFQQIKAVAVTLLFIVPALAVVGLIGYRLESRPYPLAASQPMVHDELRSTTRQTSSKSVQTAVPASLTANAEILSGATAEAEQAALAEVAEATRAVAIPAVEAVRAVDHIPPFAEDSSAAERGTQREAKSLQCCGLDGVLKVLETHVGAPVWAGKEPIPGDHGILVSLSSQRFATLQEAEQQLTAQAVAYVRQFYRDEYAMSGDWTVPVSIIERNAVHNLVGEEFDKDFGNGIQATMYQAHLQLELNSALRKALHDSWQGQVVSHRLTVLGSMLGLVTLMLATSAGYFRLDDLTGGLYRRRLKVAAASLIAAGSLVALVAV
jgi:hypothetical protein